MIGERTENRPLIFGTSDLGLVGSLMGFAVRSRQLIGRTLKNIRIAQALPGRYRKNLIYIISALFHFARARNYVHWDHSGVSPITLPTIEPKEVMVLTPAEGCTLLLGLPNNMIPAAAIALFTPIRSVEIDRMDWSRINLAEGHIEIQARHAKKKIRRIVPSPDNLKEWFLPFARETGNVSPYERLSDNRRPSGLGPWSTASPPLSIR